MTNEQRSETRQQVAMPVLLANGATGTTRDLSTKGVFLEMDSDPGLGSVIDMTIELKLAERSMWLKSRGRVVRIEALGERTGVAVKMLESKLEMAA
jgi:hypothetical protein